MVEQVAFNYSVGGSNLPGPKTFDPFIIWGKGLTAIGEVTHLLNVWMMNPCEFKSHLVRPSDLRSEKRQQSVAVRII